MINSNNYQDYWLREGRLLGLRMKIDGSPQTVWYRILAREYAGYPFVFPAAVARGAATGWTDIVVSAVNSRFILDPSRDNLILHFFVGIKLTNMILYLQYPLNRDRNALIGNRLADANGIGGWRGRQSPYWEPDVRTELFAMRNMRPAFNIFNNSSAADTPEIFIHAMMYEVEGPYPTSHPKVGDELRTIQLLDDDKARLYTVYGTDPIEAPSEVTQRLLANSRSLNGSGNGVNITRTSLV